MSITTQQFLRKPLYVDAVRITGANFDEIAVWCQGEVQADEVPGKGTTKKYIKVRVHNPKNARQTKAFVGDWLLYTERGYKVYTNKAFHASFDPVSTSKSINQAVAEAKAAVKGELQVEQAVDDKDLGIPCYTDSDEPFAVVPGTPEAIAQAVAETVQQETTREFVDDEGGTIGVAAKESPAMTQARQIIESAGGTLEPATPQNIADAVAANVAAQSGQVGDIPPGDEVEETAYVVPETASTELPVNVDTVPATEPIEPTAAEGKRVLSIEEQKELTAEEVRELVQSGEAVLAQDIAAA